jgi:hypothetical protein
MLKNNFTLWIENEADIEKAILDLGMASFGLGHDKGIVLSGDLAQFVRLLAGNIDSAFPGELHVIEIKHFVVETLQRPLRKRNQLDREIQARQPGGGFDQV